MFLEKDKEETVAEAVDEKFVSIRTSNRVWFYRKQ